MSIGSPRIVSNQSMETIFRKWDMVCATYCLITMEKPSQDHQHYLANILSFLGKHERVFEPFTVGRPPNRGFDHVIKLEEGLKPMINKPYKNPKRLKE
jgi:hypothetical protein